jgi:ER-bound oxygenase mpaB/B'/Rubber oxygenase, catalytic domain
VLTNTYAEPASVRLGVAPRGGLHAERRDQPGRRRGAHHGMVLPRLPVPARLTVPVRLPVTAIRSRVGGEVFARVAGADGPRRRERIFEAAGERWFTEDRPIRRVHGDTAMFVGGLRALLLQSLHPLAMAGVAAHSDFRADPWGRLQRTSYFLAATTFGPAAEAERAVARVRGVHGRVQGTAPDGRPYAASDPHLLRWVHLAEVDSFLTAHQRYGAVPLTAPEQDAYVLDTSQVAGKLGIGRSWPEPQRPGRRRATCCSGRRCRSRPVRPTPRWPRPLSA